VALAYFVAESVGSAPPATTLLLDESVSYLEVPGDHPRSGMQVGRR